MTPCTAYQQQIANSISRKLNTVILADGILMSNNIYFLPRKRKCSRRHCLTTDLMCHYSTGIPCCKTLKRSSFKQTQMLPSVKLIFTTPYQFFSLSLSSVWAVQVSIDRGSLTPFIKLSATAHYSSRTQKLGGPGILNRSVWPFNL